MLASLLLFSLSQNCNPTLVKASDLASTLKPSFDIESIPAPESVILEPAPTPDPVCLNETEQQEVVECFREIADCNTKIASCSQMSEKFTSSIWFKVLVFLSGFGIGAAITK